MSTPHNEETTTGRVEQKPIWLKVLEGVAKFTLKIFEIVGNIIIAFAKMDSKVSIPIIVITVVSYLYIFQRSLVHQFMNDTIIILLIVAFVLRRIQSIKK